MDDLRRRWSLELEPPFDGTEGGASWVAPVRRPDGPAVLKVSLPHMEADHEIDGLRFWAAGDPTVLLLEADEAEGAMLLERCEPGTWLRELPEPEQDVAIAGLLRRLWRVPADPHPFRPLSDMIGVWMEETLASETAWPDAGLVREGLRTFDELSRAPGAHVLLATDLHAGNVLAAEREPWLVIDAMPFVGDPAYDATQHLRNCEERMREAPIATIERFADLLEVDAERVRRWMFARAAAENRDDWDNSDTVLARKLGS